MLLGVFVSINIEGHIRELSIKEKGGRVVSFTYVLLHLTDK